MFTFTATPALPSRVAFAANSAGRGVLRVVTTAYKRRRNRMALRDLLNWNDHMLDDIGVTRDDIRCALATGARFEPTRRLQVLAVERRATALADARRRLTLVTADGATRARTGIPHS